MLPIPDNLKDIIEPIGNENNEFKFCGELKCKCDSKDFEIFFVGEDKYYQKERIIKLANIDNKFFLIVKVKCKNCKEIHELFDVDYNGWNGYVCEGFGNRINPRPKDKKWSCMKCAKSEHQIRITIYSKGKQDFIEETEGDFDETEWVNGYSWINFEIECDNCKTKNKEWTSFETI